MKRIFGYLFYVLAAMLCIGSLKQLFALIKSGFQLIASLTR